MLFQRFNHTPLISALMALGLSSFAQIPMANKYDGWHKATASNATQSLKHRADRIIVKLKPATSTQSSASHLSTLQNKTAKYGASKINPVFRKGKNFSLQNLARNELDRIYVVDVNPTQLTQALIELRQDNTIEYATLDTVYRASLTPNDTYYSTTGSWGQTYADLWGVKKINSSSAWDQNQGGGVVVAVVDTGIDAQHPDLQGQIWNNANEIASNGLDDDANGFIDDTAGWDFVTHDNKPTDDQGHGSHVSGTIAAKGNNGIGIIGVAPQARIMAVKGLDADGNGSESALAAGIVYAADNGARVINCSFGGSSTSTLMADAVNYATQRGAVVIAAAGNEGNYVSGDLQPAGVPSAITVAASDAGDQLTGFSNWGLKIDVSAPGFDILSTLANNSAMANAGGDLIIGGQYIHIDGTSMAAPHVSGVAAQLIAKSPTLTPAQIRYILRNGSDDINLPGYDAGAGYGRLNALKALNNTAGAPRIDALLTDEFLVAAGPGASLKGSAKGEDFSRYTLSYSRSDYYPDFNELVFTEFANSTQAVSQNVLGNMPSGLVAGTYIVRLRVHSNNGKFLDSHIRIKVDPNVKLNWPKFTASEYDFGAAPAYADINGDGALDVITHNYEKIMAWKSTGEWLPGFPIALPYAANNAPIVIADLDGDKKPELVVGLASNSNTDFGGIIMAYHANGTAVSGFPAGKVNGQFTALFSRIAAGDLDGDGKSELMAIVQTRYESTENNERYLIAISGNGQMKSGWPKQTLNLNSYNGTLAIADLDNDGKREIIAGANRDGNRAIIYRGDGSIRNEITSVPGIGEIAIGDLNSNGTPELLFRAVPQIGGGSHQVYVTDTYGNKLTGWPKNISTLPGGPGRVNTQLIMADIDGNGDQELLAPTVSHIEAYHHDGSTVTGYPLQVVSDSNTQIGGPVVLTHTATSPLVTYVFGSQARMPRTSISNAMYVVGNNGQPLQGWPMNLVGAGVGDWPVVGDLESNGKADIGFLRPQFGLIKGAMYIYEVSAPSGAAKLSNCATVYCNNHRDGFIQRPAGQYARVLPQLNLRGTHNSWGNTAMTLISDNTWEADVNFGSSATERFKFDVNGDWTQSYGDTNRDGIAEQGGGDILVTQGAGTYRVRYNDSTRAYSVTKQDNNNGDVRRTVIFMYGQTVVGQDMFLRGGIDWTYAKNNLARDCAVNQWLCAIPITHNQFQTDPNRSNDKYLDWYGAETGQSASIQGSPLVWTTNNASNPKKVAADGYGYTPLNKWGDHYWMLDVQMDCSKGVKVGNDTWIELKSYISNGPGWEANVTQVGAPYSSGNHFAKCGWINKFERGNSSVYFEPLQ